MRGGRTKEPNFTVKDCSRDLVRSGTYPKTTKSLLSHFFNQHSFQFENSVMKYFKFFRKATNVPSRDIVKAEGANSVASDSNSHGDVDTSNSTGSKASHHSPMRIPKLRTSTRQGKKSKNVRTIETLMKRFNNFTSEEDLLPLFVCSDQKRVTFEDGYTISSREWVHACAVIKASFSRLAA